MAPRIGPEPAQPDLTAMEKFLHAIPFGVGIKDKPRYYLDYWKSMWASRINLPFALKILKHGLCDGCSLGPAGDRDDVANGTHLCSLRLKDLRYRILDGIKSEEWAPTSIAATTMGCFLPITTTERLSNANVKPQTTCAPK